MNALDSSMTQPVTVMVDVLQSVHQLLPPPYRAVWLEWLDAENAAKQEAKEKENKVRL